MIKIVIKGIKLRIYPNDNQIAQIESSFGAVRFVWNKMLAMQVDRYEFSKAKLLTGFDMNNLLPSLKVEYTWLKDTNAQSLQQVCADLYTALVYDFCDSFNKILWQHSQQRLKIYQNEGFDIKYLN